MPRRIRILHIIQNLHYGGMERLFADIVRLLDRNRFESHVLALGFLGRYSAGLEEYASLHVARPTGKTGLLYPRDLIHQIRDIAPDVVHTHSGVWFKASLAARHAGVPWLVHTEHGRPKPDPLIARMMGNLASRRTDRVVAVSEALEEQLAGTVVADPGRLVVIRNGVDTEIFKPGPDTGVLRKELEISPGVPIIGSIGRLERIKGYDVMIEAFARITRMWDGDSLPALVIAGDGSERQQLANRLQDLGTAGQVHLLGWRDDVHDLHSAFALFTMSSRSEGTSVSLLEAMSAGICPVVTAVGGNAATLGSALAHRLVPAENPEALAAEWMEALNSPQRRDQDGIAARSRVKAEFGLERMVREYEELYCGGVSGEESPDGSSSRTTRAGLPAIRTPGG